MKCFFTVLLLACAVISYSQSTAELPYVYDFNTESEFSDLWVIENANPEGDNESAGFWLYSPDYFGIEGSGSVVYIPKNGNPGDDWVFTPMFELNSGTQYMLTISYATLFTGYPDELAIYMGNSQSASAMNISVHDFGSYSNTDFAEFEITVTVPVDGTYCFGFHESGPGGSYGGQTIDNVSIIDITSQTLQTEKPNICIFPNPASDYIFINAIENSDIEIYNSNGQLMRRFVNYQKEIIDLSSFESGVYFAKVSNPNHTPHMLRFLCF
jgi:hypothetical protein